MADPTPMEDVQTVNLYPQRRTSRHKEQPSQTDTSRYFMPSQKTSPEVSQTEINDSQSTARDTRKRQRQGVLAFSDGRLLTKKPLINPIGRNDQRRRTLAEVAQETWELLPGLLATRPDVTNDSFLCQRESLDPARCPRLSSVKVKVVDSDTIDAALILQDHKLNNKPVAILNMANASHAGGGWQHGALAQEEAICYRSSLSKTLHRKHYPIPEDAALYSPTVLIIRENMNAGHELLDFRDPSQLDVVSVISCAAVCQPFLKKDAQGQAAYRDHKDAKLMKEKMRVILRTAIRNRHRQLVLGAFGCGAFGNPNHIVARLWSEVLQENEFRGGYWKDIVFAVLDGTGASNFQVFHDELHDLAL